jgi:hypothetical protein
VQGAQTNADFRERHHRSYRDLVRLLTYMSPGFPASLFELLGQIIDAEVEFDMTMSGPTPGDDPDPCTSATS